LCKTYKNALFDTIQSNGYENSILDRKEEMGNHFLMKNGNPSCV
jgi:hypothetical protein